MDSQITATMTATIYVAAASSTRDSSGQPTWGTPAARSASVEREVKIIPGVGGEELRTSHIILTNTAIGPNDRIWLPGDSTTAALARRPMLIEPIPGELAGDTDHWEVYV